MGQSPIGACLRRDAALRREEGVFVAEGLHLAEEALRALGYVE